MKQKKSPNHKKKWSDDDVVYIKAAFRVYTVRELSQNLGRSESSIRSKFQDLGISLKRDKRNWSKCRVASRNSFWTEEKLQYVKDQVMTRSISDVAKEIGKSESTVASKLKREGFNIKEHRGYVTKIPKPNAWTQKEIAYLKRHAGKKTSIEIAKKINRSRLAVKVKATRLGLTLEKNPWSEEQTETLYQLHEAGYSTRQISEHIGRSIDSVRVKMRACLLETNYIWSEEDVAYLHEQKRKGISFSEISQKLGRTKQACSKKYYKTLSKKEDNNGKN